MKRINKIEIIREMTVRYAMIRDGRRLRKRKMVNRDADAPRASPWQTDVPMTTASGTQRDIRL